MPWTGHLPSRSLTRCTRGAVIPTFALSFFVLIGAVGLGIDSARGYGAKNHLQNAVDAAALATARAVSQQPDAEVEAVFTAFLNTSKPTANHADVTAISVTKTGNLIEATVSLTMPTFFMSVLGQPSMAIEAHATTEYGLGDAEVVLALDNTGSMAGAKLDTLKTAARDLVDTLDRNITSPEKLRMGIVPFAKYVNVGIANRNASWMDVPLDTTSTTNQCWDTYPNAVYSNCRTLTQACTIDGIPQTCSWQSCDVDYGQPVNQCGPVTTTTTWYGCAGSRSYPLNVRDDNYATRIPAVMNEGCAAELTPLTTNRSTVRNAIDAMVATGDTYLPEGVMWGWRLLSPATPFAESQSGGSTRVNRFLVVMTDGINSVSPTGTAHNGNDTTLANTYTREACTNAKTDNITIFTVAFEVTDKTIKDILKACASADTNFFDASNSSELLASFDAIAQQMVALRLKR